MYAAFWESDELSYDAIFRNCGNLIPNLNTAEYRHDTQLEINVNPKWIQYVLTSGYFSNEKVTRQ